MSSKLHSKLTWEHHSQLEGLWVERRGAQRFNNCFIGQEGWFALLQERNVWSLPGVCDSQSTDQVHLPGPLSCWGLSVLAAPRVFAWWDFALLQAMKRLTTNILCCWWSCLSSFPRGPCVPWSSLRSESCVPWKSIYSLFLHPPYGCLVNGEWKG